MTTEAAAFIPAIALAVCWCIEIRTAAKMERDLKARIDRLNQQRMGDVRLARACGWEEGRLYEYNRREPKRGPRGQFAPKRVSEAAEEMELES